MKIFFRLSILFFVILFSSHLGAQQEKPLTLRDCFELALKQSETLAIQKETIKETEGRMLQALGSALPNAGFSYSEQRQNGSGSSNFTLSEIPEARFTFSQPLFSGFKEFASLSGSRAQKRQFQQQLLRAKEMLWRDVSDGFYFYLSYQENLQALDAIKQALTEQLAEVKKREELGRSRKSEIASTEVRLRRIEAEIQSVVSQQEVGRELLEFLIGQPLTALADENLDETVLLAGTLADYLPKSEKRADVIAAKEGIVYRKKQITVARAGYFPTASVDGNYYTKRVGNAHDVDWDYTLKIDAPIFDAGETAGKVKEAKALAKEDELRFQQTKRSAQLDIKQTFTQLQSSLRRRDALKLAYAAAQKSYELQSADFKNNLVNNLDVLQSLQDLQETRREYTAAFNETKRFYWNFKVAIGEVPLEAAE